MHQQWNDSHTRVSKTYITKVNFSGCKFQTNAQAQHQRNDNNDDEQCDDNDEQSQVQIQISVNVQNLNNLAVNALQLFNNDTSETSFNC